jgi:5-methylcytosine-specific restriction endonuclease McrA
MNYHEYLLSPQWQEKRSMAIYCAGNRCQVCNSPDNLEVHHRTYERLGCEAIADLTVLCSDCHRMFSKRSPKPPFYWLSRLGYAIDVVIYD